MKRPIVIFLLLIPVSLSGQSKIIYAKVSLGNYQMDDMKGLQEELKEKFAQQGIPAEIGLSFPASIQGELGIDFNVNEGPPNEFLIGGFVNYMRTEGLVTYSDYSGRVDVEQNFRRYSLGAKAAYSLKDKLQVYLKTSYHKTHFDIVSRMTLTGSAPDVSEFNLDPDGLAFEPGFQWTKSVKRIRLSVHGGYEFSVILSKDVFLTNDAGDPVHPDWSGFRLGVGVGFGL